nr:uncharacterized mitochondrial protein AtMg00810-like [Tanacetum cinerariifolium]
GRRKEKISSKEVVFTKADESLSLLTPEITSESESESDSSTEKLLITLMEEVKGLKKQIEIPSGTPLSSSQPSKHATVKKTLSKLKAQSSLKPLPKKAHMILKPFKECKYCRFNDHHSNHYSGYSRHMTWIKQYLHRYLKESGPKLVFGDDSSGDTEGYGSLVRKGSIIEHHSKQRDHFPSTSPYISSTWICLDLSNHNKYTFVIVDEYSRYTWVFYLKKKSDVADCIMSFIKRMENLNEVRVKELRSDNGKEFKNHKLEEFYDEKGISQNFSSLCTPEQNGVTERRNKTLIEAARTMLNKEDLLISDISICLGVLIIFTITWTILESLMKKLMMDSFLDTLQWLKPSGCSTSKDKKCKKHYMLLSVKMMKQFLNPAQKVFVTSEDPPEFTEADDHPTLNEPDKTESADHFESVKPQNNVIIKPIKPKNIIEALEEEGWIIAMQEELNQFERNNVWTLDVYVQQPPGFESSEFPNHVCHDELGVSINETLFRGMIGSLMYLKASRLDIQFFTCLYARYQANPKESHLVVVKRIFRYLKGTLNLGLWYPKGSGFDLKAYFNSDYTGCNLDRKSTLRGCQILRGKLVKFRCEEGIIAFNNAIALLEHPNELYRPMLSFLSNCRINKALTLQPSAMYVEYVKEFWCTAEVEKETNTITFLLSWWDKPMSFTQDEFISAIGLLTCKNAIPLPPKETIRARLATFGLFDNDKPTLSSIVLVNSSPLKMKYFTPIWKLFMQYIVKCLGGMHGSHDQMKLNHQTISYCLIWGLEIDIGAIIFSDMIHKLEDGKKNMESNICYTRFLSLIFEKFLKVNYISNDLTLVKHHTITAALFQKPLAYEVALTVHMLKVAKLFQEPEQSLIPLVRRGVNIDDTTDKSLFKASVQPVTQPKAPTNLKTKKKRISPSSKPKSPYKVRVILPKKQVTETQHAEVTVATANITKSLVASELVEEQVLDKNIVKEDDVGVYSMEEPTFEQDEVDKIKEAAQEKPENDNVKDITPKDDEERDASDSNLRFMPSDDLATLTDFETPDSDDETSISVTKEHSADNLNVTSDGDVALPYASAGVSALSDPFGRLQKELTTIYSKVDQMESQFTKRVSDELKSYVPFLAANTLKEQLHGILSEALKNNLAQLIQDSIKSYVSESIVKELPHVVEVFKKANAEGKKREKSNQKTPKDTENLRAKFQWVINQSKKLGLPPPPTLATFGMIDEDKKRKRTDYRRGEEELHLATTAHLIRLHKSIQRGTLEAAEMFRKLELTIEAMDYAAQARDIRKDNLDGLGQHM